MAFTIPNNASAGPYGPTDSRWQSRMDATDLFIMAEGANGNGVVSGCVVSAQASPNMTVQSAVGAVQINGAYIDVAADASTTITGAHATLPRRDLIVVNNSGVVSAVAGTAATDPVKPAVPANSVALAEIMVPATDTTIGADQIVDKRLIVRSSDVALRVPQGWGQAWRQALSEADTRLVRIRGLGDSITQGFSAGTRSASYFEKIITALQAEYGDGGDGLTTMAQSTGHLIFAGITASVTHTGTWTATNVGYGGCALTSTQSGAVITRTNCRGRRVRIYYESKTGGSPFTVNIGGTNQTAVTTNATASSLSVEYTVPGGTTDPYTVTITTGGTGGVTIHAIDCYNTTGVVGHNMARLGNTAAAEISHPAYTGEASGFLSLLHLNTSTDFGTPQNNDLVIASYGVNDYDTGTTESNFRYSYNSLMQTAVQQSQGDDMNASAIIITFPPNETIHSQDGNDYFDHTAAQSIVADIWDAAYLNLYARWPWKDSIKYASGLYTSADGTHPNVTGHDWVSDKIIPLLIAQDVGELTALMGPSDTTAINAVTAQRSASGKGFVNHGSTAGTARPTGYASVEWYGTVQPTNMAVGDTWIDVT